MLYIPSLTSGGSRNFQRGFQIPLNFSLAVSKTKQKKRSQPAVNAVNVISKGKV